MEVQHDLQPSAYATASSPIRWWFDLLFGNPPEMFLQKRIGFEPLRGIVGFGRGHLIIDIVDSVLTLGKTDGAGRVGNGTLGSVAVLAG